LFGASADIARLLLAHGATSTPKITSSGIPLCTFAVQGRKEVAELLLAHGAAINAKNDHGDTPLHLAGNDGYEDEAKLLLDKQCRCKC